MYNVCVFVCLLCGCICVFVVWVFVCVYVVCACVCVCACVDLSSPVAGSLRTPGESCPRRPRRFKGYASEYRHYSYVTGVTAASSGTSDRLTRRDVSIPEGGRGDTGRVNP